MSESDGGSRAESRRITADSGVASVSPYTYWIALLRAPSRLLSSAHVDDDALMWPQEPRLGAVAVRGPQHRAQVGVAHPAAAHVDHDRHGLAARLRPGPLRALFATLPAPGAPARPPSPNTSAPSGPRLEPGTLSLEASSLKPLACLQPAD